MRVALYSRISPNPGKDDTESQLAQLREYASRMGWEIVATYTDIHVSGAKGREGRLEFNRMLLEASQRKWDVLLFWSLDRFTREGVLETLTYLKQLSDYGVSYKSYTEQYLDTTGLFKEAIISILATIAKQERVRISERVKAGLQVALRGGKRLGRPPTRVSSKTLAEMRGKGLTFKEISQKYTFVDGKGKTRHVSEPTVHRLIKEYDTESARS